MKNFHQPLCDPLETGLKLLFHDVFTVSTQNQSKQPEQERALGELQSIQQLKARSSQMVRELKELFKFSLSGQFYPYLADAVHVVVPM